MDKNIIEWDKESLFNLLEFSFWTELVFIEVFVELQSGFSKDWTTLFTAFLSGIFLSVGDNTIFFAGFVLIFNKAEIVSEGLAVLWDFDLYFLETVIVKIRLLGVLLVASDFVSVIFKLKKVAVGKILFMDLVQKWSVCFGVCWHDKIRYYKSRD